jgi:hypothetical protein
MASVQDNVKLFENDSEAANSPPLLQAVVEAYEIRATRSAARANFPGFQQIDVEMLLCKTARRYSRRAVALR